MIALAQMKAHEVAEKAVEGEDEENFTDFVMVEKDDVPTARAQHAQGGQVGVKGKACVVT